MSSNSTSNIRGGGLNANGQRVTVRRWPSGRGRRQADLGRADIGPVITLDVALRKVFGKFQKFIEGLRLIDYRVRTLKWRHRGP